jgi:L-asparaginase II
MGSTQDGPVLIEVRRGALVESRHRGAAAIADSDGTIVATWGDIERPVYPRSAIKPIQAIPLVDSGAASAAGLGDDEIALACASHAGEPRHVATVSAWLERIGLGPGDLECGAHAPSNAEAAAALIRAGTAPTAVHNNCSGKHAGMLTVAVHRGLPTAGYVAADHPTQRAWRSVLAALAGLDLDDAPVAVDGCSIPTVAVPLSGLARAAARFADPERAGVEVAASCRRIQQAMTAAPFMVAGSGRFCTTVIEATNGAALVKTGAEGAFLAALPRLGLGIAVKIDDGATRAAEAAMAALLCRYGGLDGDIADFVRRLADVPVYNRRGATVGSIRPAADWIDLDENGNSQ